MNYLHLESKSRSLFGLTAELDISITRTSQLFIQILIILNLTPVSTPNGYICDSDTYICDSRGAQNSQLMRFTDYNLMTSYPECNDHSIHLINTHDVSDFNCRLNDIDTSFYQLWTTTFPDWKLSAAFIALVDAVLIVIVKWLLFDDNHLV